MSKDELEFVDWLVQRSRSHEAVELGIGDDMAVVRIGGGRLLVSCDLLLDGVHFDSKKHALRGIGRKALACSLSDCAAMAANPVAAVVSVALPGNMPLSEAKAVFEGLFAFAEEFQIAIVGGDTTRWPQPLAIDVAIVAEPYPKLAPVTRSGARAGDRLFVTGPLGGSILGHHLEFIPRISEARCLAEQLQDRLHAMMDISDGLSLDLWRMCQASGVGAELDEAMLSAVISDAARELAEEDGRTALEHALTDGEDFELLLAVADEAPVTEVPIFPVGQMRPRDFTIRRPDGRVDALEPRGFVH